MKKIILTADSTFDMPFEKAGALDIKVIPSYVSTDGDNVADYPDITVYVGPFGYILYSDIRDIFFGHQMGKGAAYGFFGLYDSSVGFSGSAFHGEPPYDTLNNFNPHNNPEMGNKYGC